MAYMINKRECQLALSLSYNRMQCNVYYFFSHLSIHSK